MSVISSRFADELADKEMRDAYLGAQTRVTIAQQIRALRNQRGWSQAELGERLGKPQGNVARLEDIEIARYTLTTLLELAAAFDVALCARFVSYSDFLEITSDLSPDALAVPSFTRTELDCLCENQDPISPAGGNRLPINVNPLLPYTVFQGGTAADIGYDGFVGGSATYEYFNFPPAQRPHVLDDQARPRPGPKQSPWPMFVRQRCAMSNRSAGRLNRTSKDKTISRGAARSEACPDNGTASGFGYEGCWIHKRDRRLP